MTLDHHPITASPSDAGENFTARDPRVPTKSVLTGRRSQLRPTGPADYDFLFGLDWPADHTAFGRFRGSTPSPETFIGSIWTGVTASFIVEQLPDAKRVGVVVLYNLDTRNGHASISLASDRTPAGGLSVMEGAALAIDHAFRCWPLHKLYAEVLEPNLAPFKAATRSLFTIEACLRDDVWYDDQRWDKYTLALYRERWDLARLGNFRLIVPDESEPSGVADSTPLRPRPGDDRP